jgi:hypothetical protein
LKIFLSLLGIVTQFLPLILFFVFYKRIYKIVELRVVFFYVLASFFANILLSSFQNNASLIFNIFEIIEYLFFSAFFYFCIRNKNLKKLIVTVSLLVLVIELFFLYPQKPKFDFWVTLTTAILILIYCIFFFYEEMNFPQTLLIYQSYNFWIAAGCIIYLAGTLFLFLYTADIKDKQNNSLWNIDIVFEIIKNVFFSIAFIIGKNTKKNIAPAGYDDTNMFEKPF